MTDLEIEQEIERLFEENYELMRLEGGHTLSADTKIQAFTSFVLLAKNA